MLDIKFIREFPDLVKSGIEKKGFSADLVDRLIVADQNRRSWQDQVDQLRAQRKTLGAGDLDQALTIKSQLSEQEEKLRTAELELKELMLAIPNLPQDDVPIGPGESANTVLRTIGDVPNLPTAKDHAQIAEELNLIDLTRAAKVAGSRFNFLKNQAALLEFALIRMAFDLAQKHGFTPMIPPVLVNEKTVQGTGYLPQGADEVYKTQDDLYLIGTSELALVAYHSDEILSANELPLRYVAFSSCFRREAGSYGKDIKGIIRQHQFDKVELVSLVSPEEAQQELAKILAIEEELMQSLQLPYRVVEIGTGDLGIQAAKKFDLETWMPSQKQYRETHSCSNTTDFQARRLNIRYKDEQGENKFAYTLNGTAVAIGRMLAVILENGQQADGSVVLPTALANYAGFDRIVNSQTNDRNEADHALPV